MKKILFVSALLLLAVLSAFGRGRGDFETVSEVLVSRLQYSPAAVYVFSIESDGVVEA